MYSHKKGMNSKCKIIEGHIALADMRNKAIKYGQPSLQ